MLLEGSVDAQVNRASQLTVGSGPREAAGNAGDTVLCCAVERAFVY